MWRLATFRLYTAVSMSFRAYDIISISVLETETTKWDDID